MKTQYPTYYRPTDEEKKALFNDPNCMFVFDTNALLDIYRLGKDTADKVLKIIKKLKTRIVIPRQVANEYHENMLDVITEYYSKYENLCCNRNDEELLKLLYEQLNLDDVPNVKKKLKLHVKKALDDFYIEIEQENKYMKEQFSEWKLQKKIATILGPLVQKEFTAEELDEIKKEGVDRYRNQIPPGYKDAKKDGNCYGDLIIWKEILQLAKEKRCSVIFVSRDLKEDWILNLHGKSCGPRHELLEEFKEASNGTFHIYTLDKFLEYANGMNQVLDESEIADIRNLQERLSSWRKTVSENMKSAKWNEKTLSMDDLKLHPQSNLKTSIVPNKTDEEVLKSEFGDKANMTT